MGRNGGHDYQPLSEGVFLSSNPTSAGEISELLEIMARLRDPQGGCPWDREQDWHSLVPHTLEEAYEVADAIERQDYQALPGELGDLLFQVVFYARIGEESSAFDFAAVVRELRDKLIRRHPHVFSDLKLEDQAHQARLWDEIKAQERSGRQNRADVSDNVLGSVPANFPSLTRAAKLGRRAARLGFDWDGIDGVLDKVHEELGELRDELTDPIDLERAEEELGDLLFSIASLARHLGVDAETALRRANRKFERRFLEMDRLMKVDGLEPGQDQREAMEDYWARVKAGEP